MVRSQRRNRLPVGKCQQGNKIVDCGCQRVGTGFPLYVHSLRRGVPNGLPIVCFTERPNMSQIAAFLLNPIVRAFSGDRSRKLPRSCCCWQRRTCWWRPGRTRAAPPKLQKCCWKRSSLSPPTFSDLWNSGDLWNNESRSCRYYESPTGPRLFLP